MDKVFTRVMVYLGSTAMAVLGCMAIPQVSAQAASDWVITGQARATGKLEVALDLSPRPLVYGQVTDAVIVVSNGSPDAREVELRALLGQVAHFVSGDRGVRLEHPDRAEQERTIVWPTLALSAGARGRASFQFLVAWDAIGDVYLQVEVHDPAGDETPMVAQVRESPQYPAGGGGFLAQYGSIVVFLFLFFVVQFTLIKRMRRKEGADGRRLRKSALGVAVLLFVLAGITVWESLEPWLGWQATSCEVLDVRYSVETTTSTTTGNNRQQVTHYTYTPSLTLRYEGPDGSIVSSGYRQQSALNNISEFEPFEAGTNVECFYDPADPTWVFVFRDIRPSTIFLAAMLALIAVLLARYGLGSTRRRAQESA